MPVGSAIIRRTRTSIVLLFKDLTLHKDRFLSDLPEIIKIARPGFWPTQLWFYLLPFAGRDMFGSMPFWLGAIYVCFPLGLLLYGWNDLGDAETDLTNPRKDSWLFGARPDSGLRRRLPVWIAAVQLPFLIAFAMVAGPRMLVWFAAVILTNACYNNLAFKSRPILDLASQIGYLLVFVLASWLCDVPQLNGPAMVFSAIFAMQSHLFGQLMDHDQDRLAGRRSTAVSIGVTRAKYLLAVFMFVESGIAWTWFHGLAVWVPMLAGGGAFLADARFGPDRYPVWFLKSVFLAWNLVVLSTMHFVWRYGVFLI